MSTDPLHKSAKEGTPLLGGVDIEPKALGKKLVAEFIGTFFLAWSIILSAGQGQQFAPLCIGSTLMVMIFALGHVSGAHFNPAVTTAVAIRGKISAIEAAAYIFVQIAAAFAAAGIGLAVLQDLWQCQAGKDNCYQGGYPMKNTSVTSGTALLNEFMWTFALATVVLNTATTKAQDGNSFYGLAIGFTVLAGAVASGNISGGAFNPAIGIGLPAVHGHGENIWIYVVGPTVGGAAAALVFRYITSDKADFE